MLSNKYIKNKTIKIWGATAGDPFRSNSGSPNFHKDVGFSSPPIQPSRGILSEDSWFQPINASSDAHAKRVGDGIPRPQVMFLVYLLLWLTKEKMWHF
jgi:hypothetical protein